MSNFRNFEELYQYVLFCLNNNTPVEFDYESLSHILRSVDTKIRQHAVPPNINLVRIQGVARRRDRKLHRALVIGTVFDAKALEYEDGSMLEGLKLSARIAVLFTLIRCSFTIRQDEIIQAFEEIKNNIVRALLLIMDTIPDPNNLRRNDDVVPIHLIDWDDAIKYIDRFCEE